MELENELKNEPLLCQQNSEEKISKSTDEMLSLFYTNLDTQFDRFEVYMRSNIFAIPKNVLLPEDKVHAGINYSREDGKLLDEEIQQLLLKIKAAKYVNTALKQEASELEAMDVYMSECEKQPEALEQACNIDLGLADVLPFTCDQANDLYDQIKAALDTKVLPIQGHSGENVDKTKKIKLG
ncbi:protein MIS12 homolog isoform X2 [Nematostella vectensis]|nr:protein MIS12 homolog isoform X2 [Nematostella vectensis]XP_032230979.1 protein MIS12 homolog isoform X2 [Nematostella vectensis]